MVPIVQSAVTSPLSSVSATRGFVDPFPAVTARATATLRTACPAASVTRTASAPGIEAPTCAECVTGLMARSMAGGPGVASTGLPSPHATTALTIESAAHRRQGVKRMRITDLKKDGFPTQRPATILGHPINVSASGLFGSRKFTRLKRARLMRHARTLRVPPHPRTDFPLQDRK